MVKKITIYSSEEVKKMTAPCPVLASSEEDETLITGNSQNKDESQ